MSSGASRSTYVQSDAARGPTWRSEPSARGNSLSSWKLNRSSSASRWRIVAVICSPLRAGRWSNIEVCCCITPKFNGERSAHQAIRCVSDEEGDRRDTSCLVALAVATHVTPQPMLDVVRSTRASVRPEPASAGAWRDTELFAREVFGVRSEKTRAQARGAAIKRLDRDRCAL
jgi:hypothetical protein